MIDIIKIKKAEEKIKKLKKQIKDKEKDMRELEAYHYRYECLDSDVFNLGGEIGDLKFKIKEWKKKQK